MAETFLPHLVNDLFEDPVLYVGVRYERRAFLFDLGRIEKLSLRELHRITDVFVSHTHIDHFVGFDHLLRTSLNREDSIRVYGPKGIAANVYGKLAAYTWNLVENYPLCFEVREVDEESMRVTHFSARERFKPREEGTEPFRGSLRKEPAFSVEAAILDHGIPCLGFSLQEPTRFNIRPNTLDAMGIERGPWLDELKSLLREGAQDSEKVSMPRKNGTRIELTLGEWREQLVLESPGQKIVYVVDNVFSPENVERILPLARGADLFYCEATFSQVDEERARERYHLTATQAGTLARMAGARRLVPFHFSERYASNPNFLYREAMEAFVESAPHPVLQESQKEK